MSHSKIPLPVVFILAVLGAGPVFAQPCADYSTGFQFLSRTELGNSVGRLVHEGGYLYVAAGWSGIVVYDVSDASKPRRIGSIDTPGYAFDLDLVDGLAFVADDRGLTVVDCHDPARPSVMASVGLLGSIRSLTVSGGHAYLLARDQGLRIVDVSDPLHPFLVSSFGTPQRARAVAVAGTVAYVADPFRSIFVIDMVDPTAPRIVSELCRGLQFSALAIDGDRLFAMSAASLRVYDISTPEAPLQVGSIYSGLRETPLKPLAVGVAATSDRIYLAGWGDGLRIYTNTVHEIELARIPLSEPTTNISADRDMVQVAYGTGFFDLYAQGDLTLPPALDQERLPAGDSLQAMARRGNCVYTLGRDQLTTIDAADPAALRVLERQALPHRFLHMASGGDRLYLQGNGDLVAYDIGSQPQPVRLGSVAVPDQLDIAAANGAVYLAGDTSGIVIIDARDPGTMTEVGRIKGGSGPVRLAVNGHRLYGLFSDRMMVYDISDPLRPRRRAPVRVEGRYVDTAIDGERLYALSPEGDIAQYDLRGGRLPVFAGRFAPTPRATALSARGGLLYVANSLGTVVYEASDCVPLRPVGWTPHGTSRMMAMDAACITSTPDIFRGDLIRAVAVPCRAPSVAIDVMPYHDQNMMPCRDADALVAVAILSSGTFDATAVDIDGLRFGPARAAPCAYGSQNPYRGEDDVNGDGHRDLVLKFKLGESGIQCGDTWAVLTGRTPAGEAFSGIDHILTEGVSDVPDGAGRLALSARPNPFNPRTILAFSLPARSKVTLRIYDLQGRLVRELASGIREAGNHEATWTGADDRGRQAASGAYFAVLEAETGSLVRRVTLLK